MSTPISKELSDQIEREADAYVKKRWPDSANAHHQRSREHEEFVAIKIATPWAAKWEDSERRRKEAMELLSPLLDYGQSKEANIPLGASITAVILQRAKQFAQAKKALEAVIEAHDSAAWTTIEGEKVADEARNLLASWKEEGKDQATEGKQEGGGHE